MADPAAEARIRDLQRRLELDPSSRLFVALAEEFRKVGRFPDALSALQKGLLAHPNYVSAQVALGRVYLESGQVTEAIVTFSKVLASDPGNLVSAKSLADIYMSRGDGVEAIKKYKLYRALSGDRRVDDIVAKLERELAPPPPPPRPSQTDVIPPPPSFGEPAPQRTTKIEPRPMWTQPASTTPPTTPAPARPAPPAETLDIAAVVFEPADDTFPPATDMPQVLSRDTPLWPTIKPVKTEPPPPPAPVPAVPPPPPAPPPGAEADVKTRALRISEILGEATLTARPARAAAKPAPPAPEPPRSEPPAPAVPPASIPVVPAIAPAAPLPAAFEFSGEPFPLEAAPSEESSGPKGRTLADLYFAQGHYAEALGIYDDLVLANPGDEELKRLRRDAEARLLPAARTPEAAEPDPGLGHRLARIRVLKQWLSVVQAR
jgi:tetratricopeptide (TPR) repeat protein